MKKIMVVDDSIVNLKCVDQALNKDYKLVLVKSGEKAVQFLEKHPVDMVLLDVMMPEMDGYETFAQIKELELNSNVPVVFLTADSEAESELKGLRMGAMDFIRKPFIPEIMKKRIKRILDLEDFNKYLEQKVQEKTEQIEKVTLEAITTIASTIDAKDSYTKGHSVRVAEYSMKIGCKIGMSDKEAEEIYNIALLHDIGKIGIPDAILLKSSRLEEEEYQIMKTHTTVGAGILESIKSVKNIEAGALYHHEKYDGTGYPIGLKGKEIPLIGRIISIADAYDAMTSNRSYRHCLAGEKVLNELKNGRGTQFDPVMVDAMLELIEEGEIQLPE